MAIDTFKFFNVLMEEETTGKHDGLVAGTDVVKIALTNSQPTATDANWNVTDHPPPTNVNGYPTGGNDSSSHFTYSCSRTTNTLTFALSTDCVFTATAGGIGPFQFAVFYNSSSATPSNAGLGWVEYTTAISLGVNEKLTIPAGTIFTKTFTNP